MRTLLFGSALAVLGFVTAGTTQACDHCQGGPAAGHPPFAPAGYYPGAAGYHAPGQCGCGRCSPHAPPGGPGGQVGFGAPQDPYGGGAYNGPPPSRYSNRSPRSPQYYPGQHPGGPQPAPVPLGFQNAGGGSPYPPSFDQGMRSAPGASSGQPFGRYPPPETFSPQQYPGGAFAPSSGSYPTQRGNLSY